TSARLGGVQEFHHRPEAVGPTPPLSSCAGARRNPISHAIARGDSFPRSRLTRVNAPGFRAVYDGAEGRGRRDTGNLAAQELELSIVCGEPSAGAGEPQGRVEGRGR